MGHLIPKLDHNQATHQFAAGTRLGMQPTPSLPPTRRHSCKGIVHLVCVDAGQDFPLQVPDEDGGVTGGRHDELPLCREKEVRGSFPPGAGPMKAGAR